METEYIEKQLVLSKSQQDYLEGRYDYDDFVLVSDIESIPPADIRPVKRGRWIPDSTDKWVCSECQVGNNYAYSWDSITKDYTHLQDFFCPHRGADMRGGDAE